MHRQGIIAAKQVHMGVLIAALLVAPMVSAQREMDPHRPPCSDARCRKIRAFLKAHYCGESPYGNGPTDGCLISHPKNLSKKIKVLADFKCVWRTMEANCQQHGQPPSEIRAILLHEMGALGLPAQESDFIHFTVWEMGTSHWTLAEADYDKFDGTDLALCQVILIVDRKSRVSVLRKVPLQKTDADVPTVTMWSPLDLADVDGDGHVEVVLEGYSYENYWLEVDSVQDESVHTIFSGLGYYL
jgi:hypothetical protein